MSLHFSSAATPSHPVNHVSNCGAGATLFEHDLLACFDESLPEDPAVETTATAFKKAPNEPHVSHLVTEFVAGEARLCDLKYGFPDEEQVSDPDFILEKPRGREVLTQVPIRKIAA